MDLLYLPAHQTSTKGLLVLLSSIWIVGDLVGLNL